MWVRGATSQWRQGHPFMFCAVRRDGEVRGLPKIAANWVLLHVLETSALGDAVWDTMLWYTVWDTPTDWLLSWWPEASYQDVSLSPGSPNEWLFVFPPEMGEGCPSSPWQQGRSNTDPSLSPCIKSWSGKAASPALHLGMVMRYPCLEW